MNNYFKLLFYDLQKIWRGLDLSQKATAIVLIGLTIFAISYFAGKATEPDWALLYSDLNDSDAVAVVEHLKQAGYAYKLSDDKRSVFVPSNLKEDLRIDIAENDVIQDSNPGFELLDKTDFGATDFHNQMTKQRIYQGEITRTIERLSGVRKARVQLAEPERSVFAEQDEEPSASVMLILEPGYKLKGTQIKAIKNLVAYSVPRLKPEKVFLTDQRGESLSDDISKNSSDIESFRTNFEKEKAEKITKVLETIVGKDNVTVQVSAKMNFDSARATIESYTPAGENTSALSATSQENEIYDAGNKAATAATETPPADDKKKMNYTKTKTSNTYNVSKEVKQIVYAPGTVEKMTIAVAINKILTDEEKTELTNLVMSASGSEAQRGDVINITSMEFSGPSQSEEMTKQILEETKKQDMLNFIVAKAGPFIVILVLGILAFTTINNLAKRPLEGYEYAEGGSSYNLDDEVAGLLDVETMSKIETQLDPQLEKMKVEINDLILSDPQEAARLLLTFIKD
ncbi:MAG: flagellar basal-body MS-ring/collar protein FliF [Candidatus Gastranaerophilales bacterium]|nr:flagellar basal-body MS-ring/collar protein FliF [Candidatus Gastranaerophilales bacterium]